MGRRQPRLPQRAALGRSSVGVRSSLARKRGSPCRCRTARARSGTGTAPTAPASSRWSGRRTANYWTGDLNTIGTPIGYNDLRPGDMLLFHNVADPVDDSHVVLFDH